jgi:hypothetical protein
MACMSGIVRNAGVNPLLMRLSFQIGLNIIYLEPGNQMYVVQRNMKGREWGGGALLFIYWLTKLECIFQPAKQNKWGSSGFGFL